MRFQLLKDGLYYSAVEPENNIVGLLLTHFKKRFPDQKWLIHDVKRNIGVYYDTQKASIISIYEFDQKLLEKDNVVENPIYDDKEKEYQNLWNIFFKNISIKEKKNPVLQRQHIPLRFWKHLIEK